MKKEKKMTLTLPAEELVAHVIERGHAGLRPVPLPPA